MIVVEVLLVVLPPTLLTVGALIAAADPAFAALDSMTLALAFATSVEGAGYTDDCPRT